MIKKKKKEAVCKRPGSCSVLVDRRRLKTNAGSCLCFGSGSHPSCSSSSLPSCTSIQRERERERNGLLPDACNFIFVCATNCAVCFFVWPGQQISGRLFRARKPRQKRDRSKATRLLLAVSLVCVLSDVRSLKSGAPLISAGLGSKATSRGRRRADVRLIIRTPLRDYFASASAGWEIDR